MIMEYALGSGVIAFLAGSSVLLPCLFDRIHAKRLESFTCHGNRYETRNPWRTCAKAPSRNHRLLCKATVAHFCAWRMRGLAQTRSCLSPRLARPGTGSPHPSVRQHLKPAEFIFRIPWRWCVGGNLIASRRETVLASTNGRLAYSQRVKSRSFCNFLQALSLLYHSMSVISSVPCSSWRRCSSSSPISR